MSSPKVELRDSQTMEWVVDKKPRYWLEDVEKARYSIENNGMIKKSGYGGLGGVV